MLSDLLNEGPLPVADALRYGAQLADALRRLHDQGSAYGRLDPSAIDVTADWVEFTPPAISLGISPYLAPEQLEDGHGGPRCDLFALGAILYEMLAGRQAFRGETRTDLSIAIRQSQPPPLMAVPERLAILVSKCLEKNPDRRWQSAQLVFLELRLIQTEMRVDALAVKANARPGRRLPAKRRPPILNMEPVFVPAHSSDMVGRPHPPGMRPVKCPKCGADDVRPSRPRGGLEESLADMKVKFNRCYRCYHRFMRVAFFSIARPG